MTASNKHTPSHAHQHGGASRRGSHRLAAAMTCQKMWALGYGQHLRANVAPDHQLRGTLVHTCMAYEFGPLAKLKPDLSRSRADAFAKDVLEAGCPNGDRLIKEAEACARAVLDQGLGISWSPVLVEHELEATIAELDPEGCNGPLAHLNDEVVTCKPDIMFLTNGQLRAGDFKVSSSATAKTLQSATSVKDSYEMTWQFIFNLRIMRTPKNRQLLGHHTVGYTVSRIRGIPAFAYANHDVLEIEPLARKAGRMARAACAADVANRESLDRGEEPLEDGVIRGACYDGLGQCEFASLCRARSPDAAESLIELAFKTRM